MRITDTDDDYTVTADQRAALMELETLTWNYPTPQQGRGGGRGTGIPTTSFPSDDQTDTDDDDDDDSYYVDMVPYDMTERLKEVNKAFIDDPTPAECNRAITVRFREVIADYQSPREYYPSDSDDGYGDSSDLIYDAEDDECGVSSLTADVRDILADNVNVIDFLPSVGQDNVFGDYLNITNGNGNFNEETTLRDYKNIGLKNNQVAQETGKLLSSDGNDAGVPRLQLDGKQDEKVSPSVDNFLGPSVDSLKGTQGVSDFNLLKVNDSGLADLESFMKDREAEEIEEDLPVDKEVVTTGSVSLIEPRDQIYVDKGFTSLDNLGSKDLEAKGIQENNEEMPSVFFHKKESKDLYGGSSITHQLPAKSESDFATFEYADDFEDSPDDDDDDDDEEGEEEEREENRLMVNSKNVEKRSPRSSPLETTSGNTPTDIERVIESSPSHQKKEPVTEKKSKASLGKESPEKTGHKSRREQTSKKPPSPSTERKKRSDSRSPADNSETSSPATPPVRPKLKRVAAGPPTIKPALLSSDKINHMKTTSDLNKYKSKNSTLSRSATSSSSPSLSASSSSSSSSSSSVSPTGNRKGRSRTPISGPVRPTQHKPSQNGRVPSRGVNRSPIRSSPSPVNNGLALSPTNPNPTAVSPSGRPSPPYRVRKAASASDLHSSYRSSEDPEDRKRQSDAVFKAWLQQKNKQAAIAKKQQRKTSGGRSNSEIAERRARAEEAFQAWLARKREQLRLEKKLRGERRRLEDQSRYARTKAECEVAYKEWCRRKRDEVRTVRPNGTVPRSQSLERPWVQEKTRKLYSAYLNGH